MTIVTDLKPHIRQLAILEPSAAPVVSCYLNLERGPSGFREVLSQRVRMLRASLTEGSAELEEALDRIDAFISTELAPEANGIAIFARGGAEPFFLGLQFSVPLPHWIVVAPTPNIYHLVELKDTYDRFIFVMATEKHARLVEVNLGAVTRELLRQRPALRERAGRQWAKVHFASHRRDRAGRFTKEIIHVLERLMAPGGPTHLFLAGKPRSTARIERALPRHLAERLVGSTEAYRYDQPSEVLAAALAMVIEQEERDSLEVTDWLRQEIRTNGLAVAGTQETLLALQRSTVDVLVLAKAYRPDPGWACAACDTIGPDARATTECRTCRSRDIREIELREEMVRLAERGGAGVEVVRHSEMLTQLGGVGALLRFVSPNRDVAASVPVSAEVRVGV